MITNLPCGCRTKPIKARYRIKQHLLSGKTIIMDNPLDEYSPILYMQYKNFQAFSIIELPNDDQMVGEFDFNRALEICLEHWDDGWDCCYSEMTFYKDGKEVKFGH